MTGSALSLASNLKPLYFFSASFIIIIPHNYYRNIRVRSIVFCGKGVYGFLTGSKGQALRVLQKISTPPQAPGSILLQKP
jgi:hypothetical protein